MVEREHPDNRPRSFVNQLAELYKASTITEDHAELQYKRCPDSYSLLRSRYKSSVMKKL